MPEDLPMTINDLINLHYKQVDLVHKFWNYMWLSGAIVVTASFSQPKTIPFMFIGYIPFAMVNMWLVQGAQKEASLSAVAIQAIARKCTPPLTPEVKLVLAQIRPWPYWFVVAMHGIVTAFVIGFLRENWL